MNNQMFCYCWNLFTKFLSCNLPKFGNNFLIVFWHQVLQKKKNLRMLWCPYFVINSFLKFRLFDLLVLFKLKFFFILIKVAQICCQKEKENPTWDGCRIPWGRWRGDSPRPWGWNGQVSTQPRSLWVETPTSPAFLPHRMEPGAHSCDFSWPACPSSWDCLPNKPHEPTFLSQVLLLEEPKLRHAPSKWRPR